MQWILLLVTFLFIGFGLDVRKKVGMTPFVSQIYITIMKLSSAVLLILYIRSVFAIEQSGWVEYLALCSTTLGAVLVMTAKLGLRESFTWTGHFLQDARLVTDGIYRYLRNPLYTGVFIFEVGAVLNYIFNSVLKSDAPWLFATVGGIPLLYAISFNLIMAFKESQNLERQFGEEYRQYKRQSGNFLPRLSLNKGVLKNAS